MSAERGDCASVRKLIQEYKDRPEELNLNCRDSLERSALIAAIENENIELIRLLLEEGIEVNVSQFTPQNYFVVDILFEFLILGCTTSFH